MDIFQFLFILQFIQFKLIQTDMPQAQSENRPKVAYRLELEKKIQINKSYAERRNQATAMRILSYGLFGQKRYQNLYLSCSLNCFYYALKIANTMHEKVPGLAMLVKFETSQVIEYYSEPFEQKMFGQKSYSKIIIKLTKTPTEEDKKQPGFNPGLTAQQIQSPITEVIIRSQRKIPTSSNNHRNMRYNYNRGKQKNQNINSQRQSEGRHQNFKQKEYVQREYGDDRDQRRIRRNRQEDLEQDEYPMGQRKTRAYNERRYQQTQQRNRPDQRGHGDKYYDYRPIDNQRNNNNSQKRRQSDRRDRRPKRNNRYSDEED